ncbi:MAG: TonB-dependent receptor [Pseudomonadota bacterium]|nr:TonB-dependent receptor [Pseudomonadota bacterium]
MQPNHAMLTRTPARFSPTLLALACASLSPIGYAAPLATHAVILSPDTQPTSHSTAEHRTPAHTNTTPSPIEPSKTNLPDTQSPEAELPTLVITANRSGTNLKHTPASISKININSIEDKRATFVGQLLNNVAGVYTNDLGNEQHMMSIRQPINTAAVYQYLEDGLSIRPVGMFNHNALYELNLAGIAGIEILRGPASSLYGSNAVGGTINFLTQAPSTIPSAEIGLQSSSEGFRRLDVSASDTFDSAIGEHGVRLSAYASQRGSSWQQHAESEKQSLTLRHDWTLSDQTQLKNILTYNHLYTDMTGGLNTDDFSTRKGYSYQTFTHREVTASRLSSQLSHQWTPAQHTQATLYYRDNQTDQNPSYNIRTNLDANRQPTGTYSSKITENSFQSYGLDLQHRMTQDQVTWVFGLLAEHTPTQARTTDIHVQRDPTSLRYIGFDRRGLLRDFAVDIRNHAVYGQADWAILPTLHLVGGARYDHIRYQYRNHLTPSSTTGAADESRHYRTVSPKLGIIWNINPQLDLYSNYAQGFVPPEVSSLYGANLQVPNLTEATFDNVDLGLRFSSVDRRVQGEITLYRLDGKDELINYTLPNNRREPRNAGQTRHQGVELGGRWSIHPQYQQSLKLSATLAEHEYRDYRPSESTNFSGNTIPNAPKVIGSVEYQIQPIPALQLSIEGQYLDHYWLNDANSVRYDGHTLLHLRANYRRAAYELYGQILNATNKHYADSSSFSNNQASYTPAAPRTYLVGLRYYFGE